MLLRQLNTNVPVEMPHPQSSITDRQSTLVNLSARILSLDLHAAQLRRHHDQRSKLKGTTRR